MEARVYPTLADSRTLGEDKRFYPIVLATRPRVIIRPGDRTDHKNPRFIQCDERSISRLGFISRYGSHESRVNPAYAHTLPIVVVERYAIPMCSITLAQLLCALVPEASHEGLCRYLSNKYPNDSFGSSSIVTLHHIEYALDRPVWIDAQLEEVAVA
jgi:hypothetical protein